jgi:hypothetical protein
LVGVLDWFERLREPIDIVSEIAGLSGVDQANAFQSFFACERGARK